MIPQLSKLVSTPGSRVHFEVIHAGDGQIRVRVTPELGPTPDNASDEEVQLRAAMGMALTMSGTPEEIEQKLAARMNEHRALLDEAQISLQSLRERLNASQARAEAAQSNATSTNAAPASTKPETATASAASQPVPATVDDAPTLENF